MGASKWKEKGYLDVTVKEAIKHFLVDEDYGPITAEAELAIECLGCANWAPLDQGKVVTFLGGDNTNAFRGLAMEKGNWSRARNPSWLSALRSHSWVRAPSVLYENTP